MNIRKFIKLHIFTYWLFYIIYLASNFLAIGITLVFFPKSELLISNLFLVIIICSLAFTIMLGVYEYHALFTYYLGLSNLRRRFHIENILYNLCHSLFQTIIIFASFFLIQYIYYGNFHLISPYGNINIILFIIGAHLFFYAFANVLTVIFSKVTFLIKFIIFLSFGFAGYYMKSIISFFNNLSESILVDHTYSVYLLLISYLGFLIMHFFIFIKD